MNKGGLGYFTEYFVNTDDFFLTIIVKYYTDRQYNAYPAFLLHVYYTVHLSRCVLVINEPRCEKTGLWGFQPGPTQTELYSHRRWLEA